VHFEEYLARDGAPDDVAASTSRPRAARDPARRARRDRESGGDRRLPEQPDRVDRADPRGPGIRDALRAARAPVVAISPIIGGAPVKGPADRLLRGLGHEVSARGVAALYGELLDGYVLDTRDAAQVADIEARGVRARAVDTLMRSPRSRPSSRARRSRSRGPADDRGGRAVKALAEAKSRLFPERERRDVEALSLR